MTVAIRGKAADILLTLSFTALDPKPTPAEIEKLRSPSQRRAGSFNHLVPEEPAKSADKVVVNRRCQSRP